jgi:hypothetical protein
LNDGYNLQLGTVFHIFNDNDFDGDRITLTIDDDVFEISLPASEEMNTSCDVKFHESKARNDVPFWRKKEFYYLNTERLGPRHLLESNFTAFDHVWI